MSRVDTVMTADRAANLVYPFLIASLPVVVVLAPNAVVALGLIGLFGLALSPRVLERFRAELRSPLAALLAALLAWAAVASLWSPNPPGSLFLVFRLALIFGGGLLYLAAYRTLDEAGRERAMTALAWAGPVFVVILGSELLSDGALTRLVRGMAHDEPFNFNRLNRSSAILAIFAWPYALALWRKVHGLAALAFLALVLAYLWHVPMLASLVAFLGAGFVFLVVYPRPRPALVALRAVVLIGIVLGPPLLAFAVAPVFELTELAPLAKHVPGQERSIVHRLYIAQFVLEQIAERPLTGWGFDASRDLPGSDVIAYKGGTRLPLHPHNAALQIWLELGIPGVLIAAGLVIQLLRGLMGFAPHRRAAATGAAVFTMYLLVALMSFGIWQNWWVVTAWLAALIAAIPMAAEAAEAPGALSRPLPRRHPRRRSVATGHTRPPPPHRR